MEWNVANALRILLSLGLVLFSAVGLLKLVQGRQSRAGDPDWIRVLASHPLGPGATLHLVQILGARYVLSSGGGQVQLVARLDEAEGSDASARPVLEEAPAAPRRKALRQFLSLDRIRKKEM